MKYIGFQKQHFTPLDIFTRYEKRNGVKSYILHL